MDEPEVAYTICRCAQCEGYRSPPPREPTKFLSYEEMFDILEQQERENNGTRS